MEHILEALQAAFVVKELPLGENACLRVRPMTFRLRRFSVEGVGNLSLMSGRALCGLMRMETLILTPALVDAPLFSFDRIRAIGNDTLLVEWYDTFVSPPDASRLRALEAPLTLLASVPKHELGARWYDSLKLPASCARRGRGCDAAYRAYIAQATDAYIAELRAAPAVDETVKRKRTADYVNGLFEHGGPSTDAFVKALGKDKARALFETVIFGVR